MTVKKVWRNILIIKFSFIPLNKIKGNMGLWEVCAENPRDLVFHFNNIGTFAIGFILATEVVAVMHSCEMFITCCDQDSFKGMIKIRFLWN